MRRRLMVLLSVVAVAAASVTFVTQTARAADLGPLAAGVATTVDVVAGDAATFSVEVPAGARPTLTVSGMTGNLAQASLSSNPSPIATFSGADPTSWFGELAQNTGTDPVADTLTVTAFDTDVHLVLTLGFATDRTVDLTPGTPSTVTVSDPGQNVTLGVDTAEGDTVTLRLTAVTLAAPGPRAATDPAYSVLSEFGFPLTASEPGVYPYPGRAVDGRATFRVDPALDAVGSFVATVEVTPGTIGRLLYGDSSENQPVPSFDRPGRTRRLALTTRSDAPTEVRVTPVALTAPDGVTPSATFELTLPDGTVALSGEVRGRQMATVRSTGPLRQGDEAVLTVTSGPGTTGQLFVNVDFAPPPGTPLETNTPIPFLLDVGAQSTEQYVVQTSPGDSLVVQLSDITYDPADVGGTYDLVVVAPGGFEDVTSLQQPFAQTGEARISAPFGGEYRVFVRRSQTLSDATVAIRGTLNVVRPEVVTVPGSVPFDHVLTVAKPGQSIEVTVPVTAGQRLVTRLLDQSWAAVTGPTSVRALGPRTEGNPEGDYADALSSARLGDTGWFLETQPAPEGTVYRLRMDVPNLGTGSARLVVSTVRTLDGGALAAAGSPTTATVDIAGDNLRYTFQGTAGELFMLDVTGGPLSNGSGGPGSVAVTVSGNGLSTGAFVFDSEAGLVDAVRLPETGTYTVDVDPQGATVGTVTLTRITPRVITSAIVPGRAKTVTFQRGDVQRLTFSGRAGQRPLLDVVNPDQLTGARLIAPDGTEAASFGEFDFDRFLELPVLTATGTWTLEMDPPRSNVGSLTLTLTLVTDPPVRRVAAGQVVRVPFTVGQNPVLEVLVRKGQRIAVDVRSVPTTSQAITTISLVSPTGDLLAIQSLGDPATDASPGPAWLEAPFPAPADGRYRVELNPFAKTVGSVSLVVRTAADQVITPRFGKKVDIEVDKPVQNVVLPFTVDARTVNKYVHYQVNRSTFQGARLTLVHDETSFGTTVVIPKGSSSGTFSTPLFFTGTWRVIVDPVDGGTGAAGLTLTTQNTF